MLHVSPNGPRLALDRGAAVVLLRDRAREIDLDRRRLAREHSLTGAELDLLARLVADESLREIAESTRRSLRTVRGQLKSVLHKTGARNQAHLMRTLAVRGNLWRPSSAFAAESRDGPQSG